MKSRCFSSDSLSYMREKHNIIYPCGEIKKRSYKWEQISPISELFLGYLCSFVRKSNFDEVQRVTELREINYQMEVSQMENFKLTVTKNVNKLASLFIVLLNISSYFIDPFILPGTHQFRIKQNQRTSWRWHRLSSKASERAILRL